MRARGANARCYGKTEASYGVAPTGNYLQLPFISTTLGEEQGLIESDLLGQGREGLDPVLDVANDDGDLVVPVDARAFGHWLRLFFGAPATAASAAATGSIKFSSQPAVNSTITINSVAHTFVATGATGAQINIGASLSATIDNAVTVLNASVNTSVAAATYSKTGTDTLTIVHDTLGLAGNAFTLAASSSPASNGTVSGATLTGGTNKHIFTSGASILPSMALEIALPDIPIYGMNTGVRGNTMRLELSRRGLLNASLGLIARGETLGASSGAGTPSPIAVDRFAQATGEIKKDGAQLASVVGASVAFSNNLDKVETIRPDGRIEDADPGMATSTGNVTTRFADTVLLDKATGRDPVELTFGWAFETSSLLFRLPRVFLPKPKRPITGPAGIQTSFDWQGSGASGNVLTAELVNDVVSYA